MKKNHLSEQLVKFSRLAYQRKLVGGTGGNLSVRKEKGKFLITPSGVSLRDVTYNNLIAIDQEGEKLEGIDYLKPSKEIRMHLCIYKNYPEVNAVIHLHPAYVTAFSIKGIPLLMSTASSKLKLGEVPLVEYAPPGSLQLTQNIETVILSRGPKRNCLLLAKHGILVFDNSIPEAYDIAELVEETAKANFIAQNINIPPIDWGTKIQDLSVPVVNGMPTYPGDPEVFIKKAKTHSEDGYNILSIQMGTHCGTHVDVPRHHLNEGQDVTEFPLEKFMGEATILYIKKAENQSITLNDLKGKDIRKKDIVIISTGWEDKAGTPGYFQSFPYFSGKTADYFIKTGIKAIGCDSPSVDPAGNKGPFHHKILKANIGIIEGLHNLSLLRDQRIFFIGLPLKIKSGDGSPVRAIAIEKRSMLDCF